MRTVATLIAAAFLLLSCSAPLLAQQVNTAPGSDKKIVITKRSTDADGSELTETIVKKGKAAENFDVEKYLRENRSDQVQVEIRVETPDEKRTVRRSYNRSDSRSNQDEDEDNEDSEDNEDEDDEVWGNSASSMSLGTCDDQRAFLGVEEDSDEDIDEEGLVVEVIRGSAAAKAGLKTNDVILKINDQAINRWSDLNKFMGKAKPGDKIQIAYRRNGKAAATEATLITRKDVKADENAPKKGFLGVSSQDKDPEKPGVRVSITKNAAAEKAGLRTGDVIFSLNDTEIKDGEDITDFMAETQAGEKVLITYERDGKRSTTEATLGEVKSWDWNNWGANNNWNWQGFNMDVRDKEACLGVFSDSDTRGDEQGAKITSFTDESAAKEAQMQQGDFITAINGARISGHDDLWSEIAKYNPGDKVKVEYLRGAERRNIEATLKTCQNNASKVVINETDDEGDHQSRRFFTWNWDDKAQKEMRERRVITIHRGEGDSPKADAPPAGVATPLDRKLQLQAFRAYPNPTKGQITVEFKAEPKPTIVSLFDLAGHQLFREELNAFDGHYAQQFDLSEYAKGTVMIQVQQADKLYTDQVVVAGD